MGSHGTLGRADLPIEIVEEIVEALARDPKGLGTLAATSQTCRHLSSYCRRHIFSTIGILPRGFDFNSSIDGLPREYGFDNLESPQNNTSIQMKIISRIIAENPEIPKYVRTLVIFMHETNTSDGIFSSLLQHFGQITHLSLTPLLSGEPFEGIEDWMGMPDTAQDTLSKFVQRQRLTLRNLRFTKFINIPTLIILTLPHLDSITLLYSSFHHGRSHSGNVPNHEEPLKLREFMFNAGFQSVAPLFLSTRSEGVPVLDLSHLKTFMAMYTVSRAGIIKDAVCHLVKDMRQLEKLDIFSIAYSPSCCPLPKILASIHPDALRTLREIRFPIRIKDGSSLVQENLLTSILHDIPDLPLLRALRILIILDFPLLDDAPLREDFTKLDNLLCIDRYASLRYVDISIQAVLSTITINLHTFMPRLSVRPAPFELHFSTG